MHCHHHRPRARAARPTLLAAGADVNRTNRDGDTAKDLAYEAVLYAEDEECDYAVVALLKDAKGIRARHLLKTWREATRARCIADYWWRIAGEGQHAEGMPGRKRDLEDYEAEYEAE